MNGWWGWLKEQAARLGASLRRRRELENDFDEEVETHLKLLTDRFVRQGMRPEEARHAARRQFGGVTQVKNEWWERSRFQPLEEMLHDSAYVFRQFRKAPLFAVTAILTLALGIGANTAIFTLIDQLILRLLPIKDPQRVTILKEQGQFYGDNMGDNAMSYPMYRTIRDRNEVFRQVMCARPVWFTAATRSEADSVSGELVSGNYFALLGIRAAAGRLIDSNDDVFQNSSPVVVLSYAYWQNRFGGSRQAIGSELLVDNYAVTVVGIAQPGFDGLEPGLPSEVFVPVTMAPAVFPHYDFRDMLNPRLRWLTAYGRLKDGMTVDRAKTGLQPLFHDILEAETREPGFAHATPYDKKQFLRMSLDPIPGGQGNRVLRQQYERPLRMLIGVTGFVLLIACANLASLLAARAAVRQKEIAVRLAIGSSRTRIIRQLMTESLMLALLGGSAGMGLAVVMVRSLLRFLPENAGGYTLSSTPDWRIFGFSMALSVLTGMGFGLAPALQAARADIAETLKAKAAHVAGGVGQINFRRLLVAGQITLSLLLLIGAGLFIRSLANLHAVNPGFTIGNLVQFDLDVGSVGYDLSRAHAFYAELESRLEQLPEVRAAGMATNPVLAKSDWESSILVEGRQYKPEEQATHAYINRVSPGYFKALGIHLISGRLFRESDREGAPKVVVVSKSFAAHYFGPDTPLGHHIGRGFDLSAPKDLEIVGVVNDIDYQDLRQSHARQVYLCAPQGLALGGIMYVSVKGGAGSAFADARRVVHELEPKAPITNMKTVEHQVEQSLITERMIASLSTAFTILAVVLAVVGLYGVLAYMVAQRAREIGIRVALGAEAGQVIRLVMREAVVLILAGMALAIPPAVALSRFLRSELYGIQPTDPVSIGVAALLLSGISLMAAYVPARRAASADPLEVLRDE
jgi:predicted permease